MDDVETQDIVRISDYVEFRGMITERVLWNEIKEHFSEDWHRFKSAIDESLKHKEIRKITVYCFNRRGNLYVPGVKRGWKMEIFE